MIKESRGEEELGSAGKSRQCGESGHAREEKVMCALWAKESQGEHGDNVVTGTGWGGEAGGGDRDSVKSHQIRPVGGA